MNLLYHKLDFILFRFLVTINNKYTFWVKLIFKMLIGKGLKQVLGLINIA